jgi:hypothetical protein
MNPIREIPNMNLNHIHPGCPYFTAGVSAAPDLLPLLCLRLTVASPGMAVRAMKRMERGRVEWLLHRPSLPGLSLFAEWE